MRKTAAIIVSFNPSLDALQSLVKNVRRSCDFVIVIDNASRDSVLLAADGVELLQLESNVGIAKAQNIGILRARELGAEYFIFFDQDSSIDSQLIDVLRSAFETLRAANVSVAATVPVFTDSRYGFFYKFINIDRHGRRVKIDPKNISEPFPVSLAISSGTFTSDEALDVIGLMREEFFIDYVDTEWCLRALKNGMTCYAIPDARMEHAIGDEFIRFLGVNLPVHSPFRRYFRIRNSIYLCHLPWVPKRLAAREVFISILHQAILVVLTQERAGHLRSLVRGVRDGIGLRGWL